MAWWARPRAIGWPRNADGEPLAHIATILLDEAHALIESSDLAEPDWPESGARLPASGYLKVFHHLGTYGNPADDGTGGWLVRHVPSAGENFPAPIDAPDDQNIPHDVCQPVLLGTGFSVPRAVDFVAAGGSEFVTAERVEEEANAAWTAWRRGQERVAGPVFPISHLYGHSDSGSLYAHDVVSQVRPLRDHTDEYLLVLSVESWTHFSGWFGDAGNFEVWMRSSDLAEARFDRAWCIIRTD